MPTRPEGHEPAADGYCDARQRQMGDAPEPTSPDEEPTSGEPTVSEPTISEPTISEPTISEPTISEPTISEPTGGEPTVSEPTVSEPTVSEPTVSEPTGRKPGDGGPDGAPAGAGPAGAGPTGAVGPAWSAVVTADRDYFERVVATGGPEAAAIAFPPHCPERRVSLGTPRAGEQRQIGRHSVSRGTDPTIDLTGPPTDPGVSRLHAVLIGRADGGWALLDPGSENGTLLNDQEISTGVQVPLHDGDRIHLGAWTAITIRRG